MRLEDGEVGTLDLTEELGAYGGFADRVFLIRVGDDLYAANHVTLPDGGHIEGLATFLTEPGANEYMGLDMAKGISGDVVGKSFQEAREIAISKPRLMALLLFVNGSVVDIHYVR